MRITYIISLILALSTNAFGACNPTSSPFGGGSGTQVDPYTICSATQLNSIGDSYLTSHFALEADVSLTDISNFNIIGTTYNSRFKGSFDGKNHTISTLTINTANDGAAMFGFAEAEIKNLKISNASSQGKHYVAILVGYGNNAKISDVIIQGGAAIASQDSAGLLCGLCIADTPTVISSVTVQGTVIGKDSVGGVIGQFSDTYTLRDAHADISLTGETNVGGVVGLTTGSLTAGVLIEKVSSKGDIGASVKNGGGLVGTCESCTLKNSFSSADVGGASLEAAGGAVGESHPFTNSGSFGANPTFTSVYSTGAIIGVSDIGGFIGKVTEPGRTTSSAIYWNSETSSVGTSDIGTALTTAEAKQQSYFIGFDFDDIWQIDEGNGFPTLIGTFDGFPPTPTPTATATATTTATPTATPTFTPTHTPAPPAPVNDPRVYFGVTDPNGTHSEIFWSDYRAEKHTVFSSDVVKAPSGISYSAKKGKLFFIDKKDGKSVLYQSGPDGDGLTELKVFNEDILNIAVDDSTDKIFYSEVSTNTIFSTDMSGESKTKVHQANNLRPALFLVESKKTPGTNLLLWNDKTYFYLLNTSSPDNAVKTGTECRSIYGLYLAGTSLDSLYLNCGNTLYLIYVSDETTSPLKVRAKSRALTDPDPSFFAAQRLNPEVFEGEDVVYFAIYNQINSFVFPPGINNPNKITYDAVFFGLFLKLPKGISVTSISEVAVSASSGATPTPIPEGSSGDISGSITLSSDAQGSKILKDIPVYLAPSGSISPESLKARASNTFQQATLVTKTDNTGKFTFKNVPAGSYKLRFAREDLRFFADSLTVSPGETIAPLPVKAIDFSEYQCTAKVVSNKVLTAVSKALAISKRSLKEANKNIAKAGDGSKLASAGEQVKAKESALIEKATELSTTDLNCKKTSSCTKLSYKAANKAFVKAVKDLTKQTAKLDKELVKLVSKSKRATKQRKLSGALRKASDKALDAAGKLNSNSFSCEEDVEDPGIT